MKFVNYKSQQHRAAILQALSENALTKHDLMIITGLTYSGVDSYIKIFRAEKRIYIADYEADTNRNQYRTGNLPDAERRPFVRKPLHPVTAARRNAPGYAKGVDGTMSYRTPKALQKIASILALLKEKPMSRQELSEHFYMAPSMMRRYVGYLKKQNLVHIGSWRTEECATKCKHIALVTFGPGDDVPMPAMSHREIRRRSQLLGVRNPHPNGLPIVVRKDKAPDIQPFRDPLLFLFQKAA